MIKVILLILTASAVEGLFQYGSSGLGYNSLYGAYQKYGGYNPYKGYIKSASGGGYIKSASGGGWLKGVYKPTNKKRVDGGYTSWSTFSSCSRSCGYGYRVRSRTCTNPKPQYGGNGCLRIGAAKKYISCKVKNCPVVNGGYTSWSSYKPCTKSCGGGWKIRSRSCTKPKPRNGGRNCYKLGKAREYKSCNTHTCAVNGGYTSWSTYTTCTKSCGGGRQTRSRACTNPKPHKGGRSCSHLGRDRESKSCQTQNCADSGTHLTCARDYKKVGCFKSDSTILSELIITAIDPEHEKGKYVTQIDWEDYAGSLHRLVCLCRSKVLGHYNYFAIGFYGECKAAKDTAALEKMITEIGGDGTMDCFNGEYNACNHSAARECAGSYNQEYIYEVKTSCPTTTGGNAKGACCSFPFTYKNKQYNACAAGSKDNKMWCATTDNFERDGLWGNCPEVKCDVKKSTTGGNDGGNCCVFPFIYKGVKYNSCTTVKHYRKWCATTSNYDQDKRWGNCV